MDWSTLRKYYSENLGGPALLVTVMENGTRTQYLDQRTPVGPGPVWLRATVRGRDCQFSWSRDGEAFTPIGPALDMSRLSDEYCSYGEFTGTVAGVFCEDRMFRRKCADLDFLEYLDLGRED